MKKLVLFFLIIQCSLLTAQEKFYTKSGTINFEASVPSFEEVKAQNTKVTAILKTDTGTIAALALVKGFRFKIALMEEHFNENYAESDKFSKAKFSGKIKDFKKNTSGPIEISGKLTFHGVTNEILVPATITYSNNSYQLVANFEVKPEDYNINIPKIVRKKVAESILIALNFNLLKK